jgi:hypothetical protein
LSPPAQAGASQAVRPHLALIYVAAAFRLAPCSRGFIPLRLPSVGRLRADGESKVKPRPFAKCPMGCSTGKEGDVLISTNTIEGYFSILKRGINGVYHHVGKQHLHRYLSEFDFRYNSRHIEDGERSFLAIRKASGKRLKYRDSSGRSSG